LSLRTTLGTPSIDPKNEKSKSTKYSAEASQSFTSSLFEPAMVGTKLT
jgi:hypothetical protein